MEAELDLQGARSSVPSQIQEGQPCPTPLWPSTLKASPSVPLKRLEQSKVHPLISQALVLQAHLCDASYTLS